MLKKVSQTVLVIGFLVLGLAFASSGNQPALPDELASALSEGAIITFYDADGNALWSSADGAAFDPALLEQAAEVVISDDAGNVIEDLPIVAGPNDNPAIQIDDQLLGLGILLKEAGLTQTGSKDGLGTQKRERRQVSEDQAQPSDDASGEKAQVRERKEQHEREHENHQAKDGCQGDCQKGGDHGKHHGSK